MAYDNAGNMAVEDNAEQYYVYVVIQEFPSFFIPLLFMTATLLALMIYKKKHTVQPIQMCVQSYKLRIGHSNTRVRVGSLTSQKKSRAKISRSFLNHSKPFLGCKNHYKPFACL